MATALPATAAVAREIDRRLDRLLIVGTTDADTVHSNDRQGQHEYAVGEQQSNGVADYEERRGVSDGKCAGERAHQTIAKSGLQEVKAECDRESDEKSLRRKVRCGMRDESRVRGLSNSR